MEGSYFNINKLKVTYGHGNKIKDVTKIVLDKFYNKEKQEIKIHNENYNQHFSDVIYGKVKQLIFTYKDQKISFRENKNLVLSLKNNKLENILSKISKEQYQNLQLKNNINFYISINENISLYLYQIDIIQHFFKDIKIIIDKTKEEFLNANILNQKINNTNNIIFKNQEHKINKDSLIILIDKFVIFNNNFVNICFNNLLDNKKNTKLKISEFTNPSKDFINVIYNSVDNTDINTLLNNNKFENVLESCNMWYYDLSVKNCIYTINTGGYEGSRVNNNNNNNQYKTKVFYYCDNINLLNKCKQNKNYLFFINTKSFDSKRIQRMLKTNPNKYLPKNIEECLYCDGNNKYIKDFNFYKSLSNNKQILCKNHPAKEREGKVIHELNVIQSYRLEKKVNLDKIRNILKSNKFPDNVGLSETNVLFRKLINLKEFSNNWEDMIKICYRDQASFDYLLWKYKINFERVNSGAIKYITVGSHVNARKRTV